MSNFDKELDLKKRSEIVEVIKEVKKVKKRKFCGQPALSTVFKRNDDKRLFMS